MLHQLQPFIGKRSPVRLLWHRGKAFAAAVRYGFPARRLAVIGITGTDGKTTTVGMTAHILHKAGLPVGALSTAFFRVKETVTWNATQKTSPSPFVVQRFLRSLVDAGCTHAVIEYSSHGLVQGRLDWTWPSVAAITNTSEEHLDYHGTMEQYRADKGILFRMLRRRGVKVLNRGDATYDLYRSLSSGQTTAYGSAPVEAGDAPTLGLEKVTATPTSVSAIIQASGFNAEKQLVHLTVPVPGVFNLENALAAIACAEACGISIPRSVEALASFTGIPGRMEPVDEGQSFSVFVDFTVTPVSYQRTLSTLRSLLKSPHRLLVLTGSCGDRMKEKRPVVGRICSDLADVVVVSNEDPYTEDPEKIIDEVWAGIDQKKTEAHRISDRREAIRFLLQEAKKGDIVLLCGKGSDTTMWVKDGQIPWNEREIVRSMLKETQS